MATERTEQQQGEHVVGGTTSAATTAVTANDGDVTATSKDVEIGLSHIQEDGKDPGLPSRFHLQPSRATLHKSLITAPRSSNRISLLPAAIHE